MTHTESKKARILKDYALAQQVAAGDDAAKKELAGRLFSDVSDTVRYLAYGHPDVDDFVQLALVEILRSSGSYRGEVRLESWARRITVRTAIRHIRKLSRRQQVVTLVPDFQQHSSDGTGEKSAVPAIRARLAALLQRLDPERRTVVVLQLVYGLSISEIAAETETMVNTVRFRLREARKQLRKHILRDPVLRSWREAFSP